jgi:hypothetical protein
MDNSLSLGKIGQQKIGGFHIPESLQQGFEHLYDHVVPHSRNNYHPHLLGHRALVLLSLLLMSVKISSVALLTLNPAMPAYSSEITPPTIIELTNASRAQQKLGSLTADNQLNSAANAKAQDMLAKQYFAHNTPDGKTPWDFIRASGFKYLLAGENLAVDFSQAESVQTAWMNSPGHRANILNKDFTHIGIGIARGQFEGHETIFVVQMFGTPVEKNITALAEPTKVEGRFAKVASAEEKSSVAKTSGVQNQTVKKIIALNQEVAVEKNIVAEQKDFVAPQVQMQFTASSLLVSLSSPEATKVLVTYSGGAIMLDPKANNIWTGNIPLAKVTESGDISVQGYSLTGQTWKQPVVNTSNDLVQSYNWKALEKSNSINFFGREINTKEFENNFFLIFITILLVALLISIAVHRHIQHISLVANTSFVAIFACLLWISS